MEILHLIISSRAQRISMTFSTYYVEQTRVYFATSHYKNMYTLPGSYNFYTAYQQ